MCGDGAPWILGGNTRLAMSEVPGALGKQKTELLTGSLGSFQT